MDEILFGRKKIRLVEGDIAAQDVDAIVNAANSELWMGSGVAGAIKRAGGQEVEDEAVALGPIPIGEAATTAAGRLRAKYVIHAAAMGPNLVTGAHQIRESTRNSLIRAHDLHLASIAFPSIGTGVGGFPMKSCAEIMLSEARQFLVERDTTIEEIVFVLWGKRAYDEFAEALDEFK